MRFDVLNDLRFHSAVPTEVIEKYKNRIPPELLEIWMEYGYGSFADGYIKIINPDEYIQVLERSYFNAHESIPILLTGFADVITWQKGKYVALVKYRKSKAPLYPFRFDDFIMDFDDPDTSEFLDNSQYSEAISLLGELEYDECFGYVPLLALGGSEKVEKLQKMKAIQHIEMITELVGRIE